MNKVFVLVTCLLMSVTLVAQNISVTGRLVSAEDNKPLPYATIAVAEESDPGNSFRKLATNENGKFSTDLEKGKYILVFNFVGMDEVEETLDLTSVNRKYDLGDIIMTESSTELEEINVTAQRPLVKVELDKLTYSAKDDPEASTSSVLDLLRKVPLITVDGEDEIQLKGSSNFKIYVNGKPSNMVSSNPSQVLKSMPANSIKDIEVITDPGARYDAEGVGGIINIVTDKRVDDGYSGSVGGSANSFEGLGSNLYLATKYGKLGFTGNVGYDMFKQPKSETSSTTEEFTPYPLNTLSQTGATSTIGKVLFLNGSMSFEPDTINLFNLSVSRFGGNFKSNTNQQAVSGEARPYSYTSESNSVNNFGGMSFSADYQRSFRKKGELLTGSYRFERNPNDSEYDSKYDVEPGGVFYYPDGYQLKSVNKAGGNEHTFQVDYVNPLNGKHNVETGVKYIFRDNSSRAVHTYFDVEDNLWKPDIDRKNDLDHTQNIFSGYGGYSYRSGKIGMKIGLRAEQTQQNIHFMSAELDTVVGTNYFDLVPSATISYQIGMTQTIRGGYNMRISRPGIWYLNPYINDVDPNNISYGNPNLDSEQQHNFNINYGTFSQKVNLNATISYSFAKNAVTAYSFIVQDVEDGIEKSVTHNTYANIGRNHTIGTNLYLSWMPNEIIRTYINGGVNYTDIKSTQENSRLQNSGFSGRAFGGITFSFPKDFRFVTNGGFFLNQVLLQTNQSPFYFYSMSMQKSLINKKLDLSLNVQNLFSEYRDMSTTTKGEGFTQKSRFLSPARVFSLSVTYRFGDLKSSIKRVQRTITNEDVMQGESGTQQGAATIPAGS